MKTKTSQIKTQLQLNLRGLSLLFGMLLMVCSSKSQEANAGNPSIGLSSSTTQGPLRIGIALPFHASGTKSNALSDAMLDYYLEIGRAHV